MSFTNRTKIFENVESPKRWKWPLQSSLYYCRKGTFFPAKEGVHSRNAFAFLKWGTFSLLKKVGGGGGGEHDPLPPPDSAAPGNDVNNIIKICPFLHF
jgi:hypothetical protein